MVAKVLSPIAFTSQPCAACSMIVREQSAPREQVIHRDGKRLFFCSVSDMMSDLETPSPHGKVKAIYVEAMDPKKDPKIFSTGQRPWLKAEQAHYVLGIKKPRVMGIPALVYQTKQGAEKWAKPAKASVFDWNAFRIAWRKKRNAK